MKDMAPKGEQDMYLIRSECSFDAAHFLKGYSGKCRNLHGHRWRVVAGLLKEKCDALDHCLIYEAGSLREKTLEALREEEFRLVEVPFRPTAENFARYFFEEIQGAGFPVRRVEVFETPTNCAVYEEQ